MAKIKRFPKPVIGTFILVIILAFLMFNTSSLLLLADDCGIGPCSCECIGKCFIGWMSIPFSTVNYYACECEDGSESCSAVAY